MPYKKAICYCPAAGQRKILDQTNLIKSHNILYNLRLSHPYPVTPTQPQKYKSTNYDIIISKLIYDVQSYIFIPPQKLQVI